MPITNTPNLGLNKQDQGDADWHTPLNENFDMLDFDFVFPLTFNPTTKEVEVELKACFCGGSGKNKLATGGTEYLCPSGLSNPLDSSVDAEENVEVLIPRSGDLSNFYVALRTAPGSGKSRTFTMRRNGTSTIVVVTISDANTTGVDISNFGPVNAGDAITIMSTSSGTPAASEVAFGWELRFAPASS